MTMNEMKANEFLAKILARTRSRKPPAEDERGAIVKLLRDCSDRDLADFERRLFEEPDFKTGKLPAISLATFKRYHHDAGRTKFTAGEDPVPAMVQAYGHAIIAMNAAPTAKPCALCHDWWVWMGGDLLDPELSHFHVLGIVGGPHHWPELVEKHGESAWVAAIAWCRQFDPMGNPAPHGVEWHPLLRLYTKTSDWKDRARAFNIDGPGRAKMDAFKAAHPYYFPPVPVKPTSETMADTF